MDADTGTSRRELAILQPGDRVEPDDSTVRFGAWCIGTHHRGRATLGPDPAVPVPSATPVSRRAPLSAQRGQTAADAVRRYFEAQVGWQCGIHAVNNAVGAKILSIDGVAAYITAGLRWREAGARRPTWWVDRGDAAVTAGQAAADAADKRNGCYRRGYKNWGTFAEGTNAVGAPVYDNYSSGFIEAALNDGTGTWAKCVSMGGGRRAAVIATAMGRVREAAACSGAVGFVLHAPGHYTAIRGADLTRRDPSTAGEHHFHAIDSMRKAGVVGKTAAEALAILRTHLEAGHDVIVVGLLNAEATPSLKRAKLASPHELGKRMALVSAHSTRVARPARLPRLTARTAT